VVGEDVGLISHVATVIALVEAGVGIPVLGVTFVAAFLSGRRETVRVERARERQLAFTGDASHELRTPLQVIEAETSLALLRDRPADAYKDTIQRISDESRRLRTIVEDLLWLARFEGQPAPPPSKVLDLHDVGETAVERFRAVAGGRDISLDRHRLSDVPALVLAPPDWLERLAGVLLDNACRYVPDGGAVRLVTGVREGRPLLAVEDSGPGIAPDQLARIFDRFHRASSKPGGAGLGLSIADSVVRGTQGRWQVGSSAALGGAHFEVSWPLARGPRTLEQPAGAAQAPPA
jgi:signal transduction histidine kinase